MEARISREFLCDKLCTESKLWRTAKKQICCWVLVSLQLKQLIIKSSYSQYTLTTTLLCKQKQHWIEFKSQRVSFCPWTSSRSWPPCPVWLFALSSSRSSLCSSQVRGGACWSGSSGLGPGPPPARPQELRHFQYPTLRAPEVGIRIKSTHQKSDLCVVSMHTIYPLRL